MWFCGGKGTRFWIDTGLLGIAYYIDNEKREINGLLSAMKFFKKNKGVIITANSSDFISVEGKEIIVQPFYEYFTNNF